jgi:hypothetical protein
LLITDLALRFARVCEDLRIEYYITGSFASSHWGEYRSTLDVDFVVELPSWNARELCGVFQEPEWYADADAAQRAAGDGTMFNIIHVPSGLKVDVIIFRESRYDNARMARAGRVEFPGKGSVRLAAPEDVILKKLEFYREGGSDKHLRDSAGILRISPQLIDHAYMDRWASELGVENEWRAVKARVGMP